MSMFDLFKKKDVQSSNNEVKVVNHSELQVFVIYDKVAKVYGLPVFYENVEVAVRSFKSLVNKEGNIYYEHSSDFDLLYIGVYNKNFCTFQQLDLTVICNAFQLKD